MAARGVRSWLKFCSHCGAPYNYTNFMSRGALRTHKGAFLGSLDTHTLSCMTNPELRAKRTAEGEAKGWTLPGYKPLAPVPTAFWCEDHSRWERTIECDCHGTPSYGSTHPDAHEFSSSCTCCRDYCSGTGFRTF